MGRGNDLPALLKASIKNIGKNYTRYNHYVNSSITQRLITLNHTFYSDHGFDFSATRLRLQPGVKRLLETLHGDERILDLGCGNGELARALSRRNHQGSYLGVDFSLPLLAEAQSLSSVFPVRFREADLCTLSVKDHQLSVGNNWSVVTVFAVLHHIPSQDLRLAIIKKAWKLLKPEGLLMFSNWQFLNSPRLKARIQPWEAAGLTDEDVDSNDYLIDWRRGGKGLRYVHHFDKQELAELASAGKFEIVQSFNSDGVNGKLGLYQVWKKS